MTPRTICLKFGKKTVQGLKKFKETAPGKSENLFAPIILMGRKRRGQTEFCMSRLKREGNTGNVYGYF
jgi:hypothetical protein